MTPQGGAVVTMANAIAKAAVDAIRNSEADTQALPA
jgi:hypothetical protein